MNTRTVNIERIVDWTYSENGMYRAKWTMNGETVARSHVDAANRIRFAGIDLLIGDDGEMLYRKYYNIPEEKMVGRLASVC